MAKKKANWQLLQAVGERGETIFELAITDYSQFIRPLFRPAFFTDRWPAFDYVVELTGVRGFTPVLFVQVKSTAQALAGNAVEVELLPRKRNALARIPGPTYLVGVHEPTKRAFVHAIIEQDAPGVYQIPLAHELTPANLRVLYDEVKEFWNNHQRKPQQSHFA